MLAVQLCRGSASLISMVVLTTKVLVSMIDWVGSCGVCCLFGGFRYLVSLLEKAKGNDVIILTLRYDK